MGSMTHEDFMYQLILCFRHRTTTNVIVPNYSFSAFLTQKRPRDWKPVDQLNGKRICGLILSSQTQTTQPSHYSAQAAKVIYFLWFLWSLALFLFCHTLHSHSLAAVINLGSIMVDGQNVDGNITCSEVRLCLLLLVNPHKYTNAIRFV